MSLNRKARRQFESKPTRRTKIIGVATAGSVVATQAALMSPASALTISTVTNCDDSGVGSLRDAITGANADGDQTRIVFDLNGSCDTITPESEFPQIDTPVDIQGPGSNLLTIDGTPLAHPYALHASDLASQFSISGLTFKGTGIGHWSNSPTTVEKHDVIDNVVFTEVNTAQSMLFFNGGLDSTIVIRNSTFHDNISSNDSNGVENLLHVYDDKLEFYNNTVVNNSFNESMVYTYDSDATLSSNTFVSNASGTGGWGDKAFAGVSLFGNIITDLDSSNTAVCDRTTDLGANLFDNQIDTSSCFASPLPSGVQSDGASAKVSADVLALGSLADNGGPTETVALGDTSVARDYYTMNSTGIDNNVAIPGTDQRGGLRPAGIGFDVGSYEADAEYSVDDKSSGGATCTETKLGTIRFAPFSSKLSKKSKKLIRAYVAKIKDSGCTTIDLTAHTATTTGAAKSLKAKRIALSKARNAAVQKYLTKQLKKAGITVTFKKHAMGAKNPAKSNKTETGRAKNRRVVVVMRALGSTL